MNFTTRLIARNSLMYHFWLLVFYKFMEKIGYICSALAMKLHQNHDYLICVCVEDIPQSIVGVFVL